MTTSYSYSEDNRLVDAYRSITVDAGRAIGRTIRTGVSYSYDALGRRVERAEYQAVDSDWTKHDQRQWKAETDRDYLYDGTSLDALGVFTDTAFGGSRWMCHDDRGGRAEGMAAVSEFIRGNGSLLEKAALSDRETGWGRGNAGDLAYYLTDEQGSVTAVTDGYGQVRQQYAYDAFGQATLGELGPGNDVGYNGKVYDPLAKLYNYGYRDYSPKAGRFTTVDPIQAGDNWYAYCENDPVNSTDPTGLDSLAAVFDKVAGTITATYYPSAHDAGASNPQTYTWTVTAQVHNDLNGLRTTPNVQTYPSDGSTPQYNFTREFPDGTWNLGQSRYSSAVGGLFVPTDAHQEVPTYGTTLPVAPYVATGTQDDTGYGFHLLIGSYTNGCGGFVDPVAPQTGSLFSQFASLSDQALASGGTSTVIVGSYFATPTSSDSSLVPSQTTSSGSDS